MALPSRAHGLRRTIEAAAAKAKTALNVTYELDALTLMKAVALDGIAHTVLAMPAVAAEVQAGKLIARPMIAPDLETRLMVATSLNRPLTQAARAVLAELKPVLIAETLASPIDMHVSVG